MAISATSLSNQSAQQSSSSNKSSTASQIIEQPDSSLKATPMGQVPQDSVTIEYSETTVSLTYTDPRKTQGQSDTGTSDTGASDDSSASASGSDGTDATSSGSTPVDLASMLDQSNQKVQQFIDMLGNMLKQQGLTWSKVVSGEQKLSADPKTIDAAKQAVSADGEFGIKNTAERILNFAKAAAGNDPAKLSQLKDAIQQGFDSAAQFFGGKLPDISNQTHDVIMNELDKWSQNGIPQGDVTLSDDDINAVINPKNADGSSDSASSTSSTSASTTGGTISTSA
ncbi:hypothetical protein [Silvimonas iriomotensis]|uniref:DUF5610 domain-containing protein n=1 Tax=Silvimonas iriomotensis TaxID=449662 RepID=A0ABQ2PD98_9NEIS|nr:hypothetical protein [Silvimonas iriomotensis]GGP23381.1 hypothetical protein GCM10010970_33810 [Silvimonas iriomotensis]